ncbi:hypothetical protein [Paraburkholderia caledonica]|uniref:hypothetical protein n=1 Tax=Paraburkholderia caledonica TaxID=134536 RepID=UPI00037658CB|nr:hypothetical protein [Paraburkholderia caledonica]
MSCIRRPPAGQQRKVELIANGQRELIAAARNINDAILRTVKSAEAQQTELTASSQISINLAGPIIFPDGAWGKLQRSFLRAIRERNTIAYAEFDQTLRTAFLAAPEGGRDFATGLALSFGRIGEFLKPFPMHTFDPAPDLFIMMINKWMVSRPGLFSVTHDQSKPLRRHEPFLRALMTPAAERTFGYGTRQAELPLRIRNLEFADSAHHAPLQMADLNAGAAIDCLLAWSGRKPSTGFHKAMRSTRLPDLIVDGMLPSTQVGRSNVRLPGQSSLIDGAAQFLSEVGYFDRRAP